MTCARLLELTLLRRSKSGGSHYGIPNSGANALELFGRDPFRRRHPRSTARHDVLEREVALEVRTSDTAAGVELDSGERSGQELQVRESAERLDGP